MPEADSSDLKTFGNQVIIFTLKTFKVIVSMEQFFLRGIARNGFLNQFLAEAPPWDLLLNNYFKTRADIDCLYGVNHGGHGDHGVKKMKDYCSPSSSPCAPW